MGSVTLLLPLWRKVHVHAPIRDEDLLPRGDSRSTPRSMSALEKNPQRGSTHTTVSRGTALWKSLVGNPPGKTSRESHRCHDRRDGKRDTAATIREESVRACTVSKQGLTPLGRLLKYTKIHVSTGEEYSGSGPDFTQGLRPRNRRKKNPERPPRNSNVDWPVLRPPERVP
ncbi:hypothetical protein MJT46_018551 [Ovis ammon polii x Ovis aries]|nr:hypothetical protein MJT46_018551 [Ovis ammon polii x Ovis aries]